MKVGIREFARQVGYTEGAVRKAIKSGRLSASYDAETKKIDYDAAVIEWNANSDAGRMRPKAVEAFASAAKKAEAGRVEETPAEAEAHDPAEFAMKEGPAEMKPTAKQTTTKKPATKKPAARKPTARKPTTDAPGSESNGTDALGAEASFNDARKSKMIYEANIKKLEYEKLKSELVEKSEVYRRLFSLGKELRISLQAIPDRIVDSVISAASRHEAHTIMYEAIASALAEIVEGDGLSEAAKDRLSM